MRALEIVALGERLRGEASEHSECVNSQYLRVHRVMAEAFDDNPSLTLSSDLQAQLSGRLTLAFAAPLRLCA